MFSINGWALSASWPRWRKMSFCSNGSHHFCEVMHVKTQVNAIHLTCSCHSCWHRHVESIFSKFFPCDPQVKDQGGYLHPAHPRVNHPHLKTKVTNKLLLLFILSCLSHLFCVNLSVSHYSYIMLLTPYSHLAPLL